MTHAACPLFAVRSRRQKALDVALYLLLMGGLVWLLDRGSANLGYHWQWYRVPRYLYSFENGHFVPGLLLKGLWVTIQISAAGLGLAMVFGMATALLRLSHAPVARGVARAYMEAVRNTPLLIQIFFIYFVLAPVLGLGAFVSAVLALSLFEGAYASEIIRAGIVSIDAGQFEAAYGQGMTSAQVYRHIVLPQAIRRILPPLTGQAVSLVKDSALVSTIAIYDLTMQGHAIVAQTFLTFEIWFTVAAIYLALTLSLSGVSRLLERRMIIRT